MNKIAKFDLLVAVYIFCIAATELMGAKTFPLLKLFGYQLNASVAILLLPFVFTANDIISEVYGKERAKSVVRSGLVVVFLTLLFTLIATHLPSSVRFTGSSAAYNQIFKFSSRIAAASLIAFASAEFLDVFVFMKLRAMFGTGKLWFRNNASNFISQFVDTTVFMFLAFYAFDKGLGNNVAFLFSLILPYWLLKCTMSVIETPLVYAGVRWLRNDTTPSNESYSRDGVVA